MPSDTPTFPLRFEDAATRDALRRVSEETGISMNRLVQDAVAAHLQVATSVLAERLENDLEALRRYSGRWGESEMRAFARAEVEFDDPAEGRMVGGRRDADPFGVRAAFADRLGR